MARRQWTLPYRDHPLVRHAPEAERRRAMEDASVADVEFRAIARILETAPARDLARRVQEAARRLWTLSLAYPGADSEAWYGERLQDLMKLVRRRLVEAGLAVEIEIVI